MKKIIMSFFFNTDGDFQPPYFWITLFCIAALAMVILRFLKIADISDVLILGVLGFIASWATIYNWDKHKENNNDKIS